ncbi:MAG: glycosyl transferase [Pseudomonadota bacterium]
MALTAILAAAFLAFVGIRASLPLLQRYALARPNARSSHSLPTPQGGGWAVVAAALVVFGGAVHSLAIEAAPHLVAGLVVAAAGLALLGAWDDVRPLGAGLRLAVQTGAVVGVLWLLGADQRLLPWLGPWAVEFVILALAGVWFVNLVNFMDGLDWLTVTQMVPLTLAVTGFGLLGIVEPWVTWLAAALAGGLLGFAPFNRPVARLFLGDVGSLPIGLLAAVLLLALARAGEPVAALLLPLYYLIDATWTLLRRIRRGERFWEAHRSHFYQQATTNGFTPIAIVRDVGLLQLALIALAGLSIAVDDTVTDVLVLGLGAGLVAVCAMRFAGHWRTRIA